jgi:hypothetical protein
VPAGELLGGDATGNRMAVKTTGTKKRRLASKPKLR